MTLEISAARFHDCGPLGLRWRERNELGTGADRGHQCAAIGVGVAAKGRDQPIT
jgi:hypothetical protein